MFLELLNDSSIEQKAIRLSNAIFDNPEEGYREVKSSAFLKDFLRKEGFTIEENTGGIPTAFRATFGEGKPVIGLLAEYDALNGMSQEGGVFEPKPSSSPNGHGCGHNLLGAGCALAGVYCKRYLKKTGKKGTIIVFGCPAEEFGSGKAFMAKEGVFKGLDAALTWHPAEYTCAVPASTMANIQVLYSFMGKSAHAAASPHMGRSALDAVELMNVGANYLREHIPPGTQLHYAVTDTGGLSPNVVQSHASVLYLIRAPKSDSAIALKERVDKVAQGAALMTETEVSIRVRKACSHFIPNLTLGTELYQSIMELGLPVFDENDYAVAQAIRNTTPTKEESTGLVKKLVVRMAPQAKQDLLAKAFCADINTFVMPSAKLEMTLPGSSDCGDVSLNCPTAWLNYVTCAQGTPSHSWQMVAQGKSTLAHKGMLQAAKTLAHTIVKLFNNPEITEMAQKEFLSDMNGQSYQCPIPTDIQPPI